MDEYIKQSINARKNALTASYEISAEMQKEINKLFSEIEKLGAKCKDVGKFETEFAKSPLNQQYMDLFTKIATNSQAKVGEIVTKNAVGGIANSAIEQAKNAVLPTRASVHQKASDTLRNVPVLGDAIDIGQKASYLSHLGKVFKKKKNK